ncbi:N,N-dimethylformamidase beta subunit family domain-containing protein [Anaeromyxobacter oryzae]|uniref:N,N-dimethylformamidase beta subunit-like C-terminal domain-containing protein n=1 Tax=Anaeromyxobacter oryzae TaxID=2918170 RepID=A0ABM7WNQ5_9BACT|nr:N,N-dimethylformamidase beta subunit family domain-containing protein [Anaeromyxobacter oryzae]BDG01102.1 hypothetical protein AMOR_00980 [Anaeromyxobacter oryzae]
MNPIPAENANGGDWGWADGQAGGGHLEAYADRVSAHAGETTRIMARSDVARGVTWVLYRLGWYGGAGARAIASGGPATVGPQPPCPPAPGTGLVRCAWPAAFTIPIDGAAVSGLHVVKLLRDDGVVAFAPVVVVDERPADLLFQAAVNTWQAYNSWGGTSLYDDPGHVVSGSLPPLVSFDRPYGGSGGLGPMLYYELPFVRFAERNGYDVSYTTDVDVSVRGWRHVFRAGAVVVAGHDEYWSGAIRDTLEAVRDAGMPLLFFSANTGYWKIRYDDLAQAPANPRVIACYKSTQQDPGADPVSGPERTGRFRDPQIARPENGLVGAYYESWLLLSFPLVVTDPSSWLFAGTGLGAGDTLPLVVGVEYDVVGDNGADPPGLRVDARSPVLDAEGSPGFAAAVHYRAPSGALVFDAGSIRWPQGLDPSDDAYDPRVERMTANVLRQALGLDVPAGVGAGGVSRSVYAPPSGPFARSVTTRATGLSGPTGVAMLPDGTLAVAEPRNNRILRVTTAGAISVLAGDLAASRLPQFDGVPGLQARFDHPTSLLSMPDGSVLVSDTVSGCIRRIGTDPDHIVTTFAGAMGQPGRVDGSAANARFSFPMGLAYDALNRRVLVADSANDRVRAIDAAGNVTTLAGGAGRDVDGPGATAGFVYPTAVAAGPDGRVYVVSSVTGKVKAIGADPAHTVITLAGGALGAVDGRGNRARLAPQAGAVFTGGQLLVSDPAGFRVRAVLPGTGTTDTVVSTWAGTGAPGAVDGPGSTAELGLPAGLGLGANGCVYVADAANGAIRALNP